MDGKLKQPMFSEAVTHRTKDVVVSVQTAYLPAQSSPENDHYMFVYRIRITNESERTVQLLRRRWHITDAIGRKRRVEGDGVIGQQPVLAPGESHEYMSGCDFKTPVGRMRGHFFMVRDPQRGGAHGEEFKVRVPTFVMATPFTLN